MWPSVQTIFNHAYRVAWSHSSKGLQIKFLHCAIRANLTPDRFYSTQTTNVLYQLYRRELATRHWLSECECVLPEQINKGLGYAQMYCWSWNAVIWCGHVFALICAAQCEDMSNCVFSLTLSSVMWSPCQQGSTTWWMRPAADGKAIKHRSSLDQIVRLASRVTGESQLNPASPHTWLLQQITGSMLSDDSRPSHSEIQLFPSRSICGPEVQNKAV